MSHKEAKFTSYSDFIDNGIDPTKEVQAAQLRSGLIYPNNPCLIPIINNKFKECFLCKEKYQNLYSLNKHLKIRHLKNNINIKEIIIPKWYCIKCKKEFSYNLDTNNQKNNNDIKHFCVNSKQKIVKIDNDNKYKKEIKLCSINNNNKENQALTIKRIRYECRKSNDLSSIEQWLKYELITKELTRFDYINAAKMFIAVKGYKIAIQLLQKSISEFIIQNNDDCLEQNLIEIANRLKQQTQK